MAKKEKAEKALAYVAKINRCPAPKIEGVGKFEEEENVGVLQLLVMPGMKCRLAIISFNWIVTTICYYGISLSTSLFDDIFLAFIAMAAMEIPSYLFCMLVADKFGRKPILSLVQIIAAVACIVSGCLPQDQTQMIMAFTLIGKFGSTAAFAIVFVYTAELFPTQSRNSALGLCSTCARLGGICAPLIPQLAKIAPQLPFLVMGIPSLIGGILACKLPETAGKKLPNTVQDALDLPSHSEVTEEELKKDEDSDPPESNSLVDNGSVSNSPETFLPKNDKEESVNLNV